MTQISRDDIAHLAQLSGLQLTNDETTALSDDVTRILAYIQQLGELPTDDATATYQVTDLQNVWREDEAETSLVSRSELLTLAPEAENDQIKVPKVL